MSVTASCGHLLTEEEGHGKGVSTMDFHKDGTRTVCWQSVCDKCYKWYKSGGYILETDEQRDDWMSGKTPYPSDEDDEHFGYPELREKVKIKLKDNLDSGKTPPAEIDAKNQTITIHARKPTQDELEYYSFREVCELMASQHPDSEAKLDKMIADEDNQRLKHFRAYVAKNYLSTLFKRE